MYEAGRGRSAFFFFAEAGVLVGFRFFVVECVVSLTDVEYAVSPG